MNLWYLPSWPCLFIGWNVHLKLEPCSENLASYPSWLLSQLFHVQYCILIMLHLQSVLQSFDAVLTVSFLSNVNCLLNRLEAKKVWFHHFPTSVVFLHKKVWSHYCQAVFVFLHRKVWFRCFQAIVVFRGKSYILFLCVTSTCANVMD